MNSRLTNQGFTLPEILIVIVIIVIVSMLTAFSFSKLNSSQALEKSADLVASVLNEARSLTLSSKGDSQYGVYLEASQVVLFRGDIYSPSDPTNVFTSINSLTGIRSITLVGGGTSVVFKRLTGSTDEAGTVEVFLQATPETFRTVTIGSIGVVSID